MNVNDWLDPKVIIAAYAAVVSTISLVWNIVNHTKVSKRKITVKVYFEQSFATSIFGTSPVFPTITVEITNSSSVDINVKAENFYLCGKRIELMGVMTDAVSCVDMTGAKKFPVMLKPGEIVKDTVPINNLVETLKYKLKPNNKLKVEISDSLNKKYYSKKFKFKTLIKQCEFSSQYNKQNIKK